jgi:hypothetical protein
VLLRLEGASGAIVSTPLRAAVAWGSPRTASPAGGIISCRHVSAAMHKGCLNALLQQLLQQPVA